MSGHYDESGFVPLNIAVLTISDTRVEETDKSGKVFKEGAEEAGHKVVDKVIVKDDIYEMRAVFSRWIADRRSMSLSAPAAPASPVATAPPRR